MPLPRVRFTTRKLMVATLIAGAASAVVLSAAERRSFRDAARHHNMKTLAAFGGDWDRSVLGYRYHTLMERMCDLVADLRGEPESTDPFPGVSFDEMVKLVNESPQCVFPPFHQLEESESRPNAE